MKVALFHVGYFIALFFLSVLSFFVLLGAGFAGHINTFVLLIPFIFSVLWLCDYTWRMLSTNPDKIQLISARKNWTFISIFLSGILTVYSLFLTTLTPASTETAPSWIFLGTPIMLLLIWYWLLYRYIKHKNNYIQWMLRVILLILSLLYAYEIFTYYIVNTL
ncbi:hypothetical protein [Saliterribacillus persicus]|uniref:Uncharacterized protein n=1 Tax=Saliterribacillus persicus TaxID=930114 RepID=A0A368X6K3_9BACI|nr:hypothetical protein [Saliterribacillus persicus]RCW63339.1 hypothetical protein DFR57_1186 [Saliterribacillus persicus]